MGSSWGWWERQVSESPNPYSSARYVTAAGQLSPGQGIELDGGVNRVVENNEIRKKTILYLAVPEYDIFMAQHFLNKERIVKEKSSEKQVTGKCL